jgi:hypothetical protein
MNYLKANMNNLYLAVAPLFFIWKIDKDFIGVMKKENVRFHDLRLPDKCCQDAKEIAEYFMKEVLK